MARVKLGVPPADSTPSAAEEAAAAAAEVLATDATADNAVSVERSEESGTAVTPRKRPAARKAPAKKPAPAKKAAATKKTAAAEKKADEEVKELTGLAAVTAAVTAEGVEGDALRLLRAAMPHGLPQGFLVATNVRIPHYLTEAAARYCDRTGMRGPSFQNLVAVLLDAFFRDAGLLDEQA